MSVPEPNRTAARAADIRATTYKLADGTRLTADRTAMRADLDWACAALVALVAERDRLREALRLARAMSNAAHKQVFQVGAPETFWRKQEAFDKAFAALSAVAPPPPPLPQELHGIPITIDESLPPGVVQVTRDGEVVVELDLGDAPASGVEASETSDQETS